MTDQRDDESLDELAEQAARLEEMAKSLRAKLSRRDEKSATESEPSVDDETPAEPEPPFSIKTTKAKPAAKGLAKPVSRELPQFTIRESSNGRASGKKKPLATRGKTAPPSKLDPRERPKVRVEKEEPEHDSRKAKLVRWFKTFIARFSTGGLISIGLHIVVMLALGFYVFELPHKKQPVTLMASDTMSEEITPIQELTKIETPVEKVEEEVTPVEVPTPTPVVAPAPAAMAPQFAGEIPTAPGTGTAAFGGLGDGDLLADVPQAAPPKPAQPGKTAFFGTARTGNKFMFIIDNSGSMRGKPFDVARTELFKSISSLKAPQKFYVIFYSGETYQMYSPDIATEMAEPNKENLEKLYNWLGNMQVSSGGKGIYDAFRAAMKQEPDVIFLLADGEMSDNAVNFLLDLDTKEASINCIGFASQEGALNLKRISDKHKGAFQFIPAF